MKYLGTAGIVAMIALAGCSRNSEPTDRSALEKAFLSEFGFQPDSGVTNINSRTATVHNSPMHWMRCSSTSNTLQRAFASGFKPVTAAMENDAVLTRWEQSIVGPDSSAPKWWKRPTKQAGVVYFRENFRSDLPASYAYFWVDEEGMLYLESCAWKTF